MDKCEAQASTGTRISLLTALTLNSACNGQQSQHQAYRKVQQAKDMSGNSLESGFRSGTEPTQSGDCAALLASLSSGTISSSGKNSNNTSSISNSSSTNQKCSSQRTLRDMEILLVSAACRAAVLLQILGSMEFFEALQRVSWVHLGLPNTGCSSAGVLCGMAEPKHGGHAGSGGALADPPGEAHGGCPGVYLRLALFRTVRNLRRWNSTAPDRTKCRHAPTMLQWHACSATSAFTIFPL
eukprot:1160033-Pelagomonas_calceolata.AAC.7